MYVCLKGLGTEIFWYPFFTKYVHPTEKIGIPPNKGVPETIKGVVQLSKVLELMSIFSSLSLTYRAKVLFLELNSYFLSKSLISRAKVYVLN